MVTVDVKGNWPRWLKVRDLTKGVTYFFRVQARTIAYGPELQANVTAGPAEGEYQPRSSSSGSVCTPASRCGCSELVSAQASFGPVVFFFLTFGCTPCRVGP